MSNYNIILALQWWQTSLAIRSNCIEYLIDTAIYCMIVKILALYWDFIVLQLKLS